MAIQSVGVVGAGAWGTALAQVAARAGREVMLWARESEVATAINNIHENTEYLPGVPLSDAIHATNTLADMNQADIIIMVTPAQHLGTSLKALSSQSPASRPLVLASKGIEQGSRDLMSEVAAKQVPDWPLAVLSGPTFAAEVARGLPTAITLACADKALGKSIVEAIGLHDFRPYWSGDVAGAEIGGAVKNVLAIACGIVAGRDLGENARAALITRGFAEMTRYGLARGAQLETLSGLSGLGDLILTCSSLQSRNMSLGAALGRGDRLEDILARRNTVAEGMHTAPVLAASAQELGVDMPIVTAIAAILDGRVNVEDAIQGLLSRPFRAER